MEHVTIPQQPPAAAEAKLCMQQSLRVPVVNMHDTMVPLAGKGFDKQYKMAVNWSCSTTLACR